MSSSSLHSSPVLSGLYNDACRLDEFATKRYWTHAFNKFIFQDERWIVSSEQPPRPTHDLTRIDLIVEDGYVGPNPFFAVLYVEAKTGRADVTDVIHMETKVFQDALKHHSLNDERERMWVATVFGPNIRLWVFRPDSEYLIPYCPLRYCYGRKEPYINFKYSEDIILQAFHDIKESPTPPDLPPVPKHNYPQANVEEVFPFPHSPRDKLHVKGPQRDYQLPMTGWKQSSVLAEDGTWRLGYRHKADKVYWIDAQNWPK